jgi:hypothetical protein
MSQGSASQAFDFLKRTGRFLGGQGDMLNADAEEWWEVWAIGAEVEAAPGAFTAVVPLPFVADLGYGTREHGVWVSDPGCLKDVSSPHSQTDQELGGLLITVQLRFGSSSPGSATVPGG